MLLRDLDAFDYDDRYVEVFSAIAISSGTA